MSQKEHFQLTIAALMLSMGIELITWIIMPVVSWMRDPTEYLQYPNAVIAIFCWLTLILQGPVMGGIWLMLRRGYLSRPPKIT